MVATEGYDEPSVEVVVMMRPTKSRPLYAQMIGRGTRPIEAIAALLNDCEDAAARRAMIQDSDKPHCTVLDFVGNAGRHRLVTVADLMGEHSEAVRERARKKSEKEGVDVLDALTEAERKQQEDEERKKKREEAAERRRQALAAKRAALVGTAHYHVAGVNSNGPRVDRGVTFAGHIPANLLKVLRSAHVSESRIARMDAKKAKAACQWIFAQRARMKKLGIRLCSYSQAAVLSDYGWNVDALNRLSAEGASKEIEKIAVGGWKRDS